MIDNQDVKLSFGMAIRKYRNQLNISQEKLAELTGLHRTYISEVERGVRNISIVNIYKIAKALDVSLSEIFLYMEAPDNDR